MLIFWHPGGSHFHLFAPGVGGGGSGFSALSLVGINAELSPRQLLSFNHLANLYRPVRTYAADSKPSAESYQLAYVDVPCRFEILQSTDTTSALGRIEQDNQFSVDSIHFAEQQEVDDNWWIKNVSLRPDGSPADTMNGRWWVVRGQPQVFAKSERREGGKKLMKASQEQNPPLGIED